MQIRIAAPLALLIALASSPSAFAVVSETQLFAWGRVQDQNGRDVPGLTAEVCVTAYFNVHSEEKERCSLITTDAFGQFRMTRTFEYLEPGMPFSKNKIHVVAYEAVLKARDSSLRITGAVDQWPPIEKSFSWHSLDENEIEYEQHANFFFRMPGAVKCGRASPEQAELCKLVLSPLDIVRSAQPSPASPCRH